jgi:hypothetical protein
MRPGRTYPSLRHLNHSGPIESLIRIKCSIVARLRNLSSERYAAASRRPSREDYSPCLIVKDGARQRLAYAYYENELGSQVAQQRCGTPDCGSHRQAARAVAEGLAPLFRFHSFRQRHSAFLAFVDAKCRKRTYSRHVSN